MLAPGPNSPPRDSSPGCPVQALPNKKRKHTTRPSSPAPSDSTNPANPDSNVVLAAKNHLPASTPRLTVSRGPTLVPISEGSEFNSIEQIAYNRIGFRYVPAGVALPGSANPYRTIESAPQCLRISWEDRSPFLKITADASGLLGDKGFRSARCNAPIREGRWYMEVKIEHGGGEHWGEGNQREGSHVRLGWGRREAPLNGPVGLDGYSYGYRDKSGEKVTLSRPRPYGRPFTSGDVIGMYISLPPLRKPNTNDLHDPAHVKRERIAIEFKGQEYFESLEYPQSKEMIALMDCPNKSANVTSMPSSSKKSATVKNLPDRARGGTKSLPENDPLRPLPTLSDSFIAFFVNGECQGIAFQDLYDFLQLPTTKASRKGKEREKKRNREGTREHKENRFDDGSLGYYPFISLFNHALVRINPGPAFAYPPPPDVDAVLKGTNGSRERTWRPVCERYAEYMDEQWALDKQEEEEAKIEAERKKELDIIETEKKVQKEKKRLQQESRKRAKKAVGEVHADSPIAATDDDRFGPLATLPVVPGVPEQFVYRLDLGSQVHSPAPTFASSIDFHGAQSGCNSECADGDADERRVREEVLLALTVDHQRSIITQE